jgi:hypothetical protein
MPFRHIQDPGLRDAMAKAYDLACASLKMDGTDPRSGILATTIVRLGERESDPHKLAELALAELRKINKRR